MGPGDIFYSPAFEFFDGEHSAKLIILLNNPNDSNTYYFVLITTTQWRRIKSSGCYPNELGGYYFFTKNVDWFIEDTWVLFEIYEKKTVDILSESFKDNLEYKATMKKNNLKALIRCIKSCRDVTRRVKALLPPY